jgi:hypothetical protein
MRIQLLFTCEFQQGYNYFYPKVLLFIQNILEGVFQCLLKAVIAFFDELPDATFHDPKTLFNSMSGYWLRTLSPAFKFLAKPCYFHLSPGFVFRF